MHTGVAARGGRGTRGTGLRAGARSRRPRAGGGRALGKCREGTGPSEPRAPLAILPPPRTRVGQPPLRCRPCRASPAAFPGSPGGAEPGGEAPGDRRGRTGPLRLARCLRGGFPGPGGGEGTGPVRMLSPGPAGARSCPFPRMLPGPLRGSRSFPRRSFRAAAIAGGLPPREAPFHRGKPPGLGRGPGGSGTPGGVDGSGAEPAGAVAAARCRAPRLHPRWRRRFGARWRR